jgi:hypothetical protein
MLKEDKMKDSKIYGLIFQAANVVKLHHLHPTNAGKLGSAAEHAALSEAYGYLSDFGDNVVEAVQGEVGLIDFEIPKADRSISAVECLDLLCEAICEEAKEAKPWLANMYQELEAKIYKTKYKLTNLK